MDQLKKTWVEPKLIVHGDVAKITQQINKDYGASDGYLFQGTPIGNTS
jgi:hypothetical protein